VLQKCMVFKERGTLVQPREKVIHVCEFFSIYIYYIIFFSFQRKCFTVTVLTLTQDTSKSARYKYWWSGYNGVDEMHYLGTNVFIYTCIPYTHVLYSKVQTLDFTGTWSIEK
jgi:hypothetical protein